MFLVSPSRLWEKAEFRIDHVPAVGNPFDPEEIQLEATFTTPSGQSLSIPAFWYQDYSRGTTNGGEF